MTSPPLVLVDTPDRLAEACAALEALPRVGLDTEFHAERRYRPELMLVQLAADDGRTWIVDPRAVDPAPLARALSGRTWVAFSADTDAALLLALGAEPAALLDPQRLAGLTGHPWPLGLADLCETVLGEPVEKAPALSDWSRRPLSPRQLAYAADDARFTLRLWDALAAPAEPRRVAWAREEGARCLAAAARPPDPDRSWRSLRVASRLDPAARRALGRLSAWREARAAAADQPPWSIVPDAILLDLARRRPADLAALAENRRIATGLVRRHGAALLQELARAEADPAPPPPPPDDREDRRALLGAWSVAAGRALGVAPRLLLPEGLRDRVAVSGRAALDGWRGEVAGNLLDAFLAGTAGVFAPAWRPRLGPPAGVTG